MLVLEVEEAFVRADCDELVEKTDGVELEERDSGVGA